MSKSEVLIFKKKPINLPPNGDEVAAGAPNVVFVVAPNPPKVVAGF